MIIIQWFKKKVNLKIAEAASFVIHKKKKWQRRTKFQVSFGTNNGDAYNQITKTKYYSPYTYIRNLLKQYESADKREDVAYKLTQALYHYSEAAYAYFNASSQS